MFAILVLINIFLGYLLSSESFFILIAILILPFLQYLLVPYMYKPLEQDEAMPHIRVWFSENIYPPSFVFNEIIACKTVKLNCGASYIVEQLEYRNSLHGKLQHYVFRLLMAPVNLFLLGIGLTFFIIETAIAFAIIYGIPGENTETRQDLLDKISPVNLVIQINKVMELIFLQKENIIIDASLSFQNQRELAKSLYEYQLITPLYSLKQYLLRKRLKRLKL